MAVVGWLKIVSGRCYGFGFGFTYESALLSDSCLFVYISDSLTGSNNKLQCKARLNESWHQAVVSGL